EAKRHGLVSPPTRTSYWNYDSNAGHVRADGLAGESRLSTPPEGRLRCLLVSRGPTNPRQCWAFRPWHSRAVAILARRTSHSGRDGRAETPARRAVPKAPARAAARG